MSAGVVTLVLGALRTEPCLSVREVTRAVHAAAPEVLLLGEQAVAGVLELLRREGLAQVEEGRWSVAGEPAGWS